MFKLLLPLLLVLAAGTLAACAGTGPATPAPTGITSNNGGGMRPAGTTLGTTVVQ